jgi:hypothetical protein
MTETELFTPKECAGYRRCSVRKLDRERAEGRGCAYVRIDGRIFYRRSDVDDFIAANVRGGDHGIAVAGIDRATRRNSAARANANSTVTT